MNRYPRFKTNALTGLSLLFLLIYVSGIFVYPVHSISHLPQEEEVCYQEDDACHLRLVHHDTEKGCDHESHFTQEVASCDICPLVQTKNEKEFIIWSFTQPDLSLQIDFSEIQVVLPELALQNISTRGPPQNS